MKVKYGKKQKKEVVYLFGQLMAGEVFFFKNNTGQGHAYIKTTGTHGCSGSLNTCSLKTGELYFTGSGTQIVRVESELIITPLVS